MQQVQNHDKREMIIRELNFKDGSKGLRLKNGITGAMLYGTPDVINKGNVANQAIQAKRNTKGRVLPYLEQGLHFLTIARKIGMSRGSVDYYFNMLKKELGETWADGIRKKQLEVKNEQKN